MNFDELTDIDIGNLIALDKQVANPNARWTERRGSRQRDYRVDGGGFIFGLFLRQNTFDEENFSCGLRVEKPGGGSVTLLRYNGSNHRHDPANYECHIHKATEQAIIEGRAPESDATVTTAYRTLDGALFCLCQDANIVGICGLQPDEPDLFSGG